MSRARALLVAGLVLAACTPVDKQSVLTINVTGGRSIAPGTVVTLTLFGRTITGDTTTPASGAKLTLTATNGTVDPTTVTLGADGKATAKFTACAGSDPTCKDGVNAVVKASGTIGGTATSTATAFTLSSCDTTQANFCQLAACDQVACTDATGTAGKCSASSKSCETGTVQNADYSLAVTLFDDAGDRPRAAMRAIAGGPAFKLVATLTDTSGSPAPGKTIDVAVTGGIGQVALTSDATDFAASAQQATGSDGTATVWFKPADSPANGIISVTLDGTQLRVDSALDTTIPGTLVFVPPAADPAFGIMGVKTSGYREQQVLTFQLLDSSAQPFTGQATLKFAIVSTGGASIAPDTALLDASGEASVTVYSGTTAGTLAVHASAYLGTDTSATAKVIAETTSPTLAIVGAKANGRNFAVTCHDESIPSLWRNDCSFMRTDITEKCTAVVGDRFNNRLGAGGEVTWHTEAGLFGPPSHLPVADPTTTDDGALGRTDNIFSTLNTRMPEDVPPAAGELRVPADPNERCVALDGSPLVRNPRDGLVTFIVTTQGEEGFYDANGNGVYDQGEDFIDQGEPYIDANDNNQWDPGEEFIDSNNNGQYDGPNGKWDSDTTIWAVGHLMLTNVAKYGNPQPAELVLPAGGSGLVTLSWQDENGNSPSLQATTFGASLVGPGTATLLAPNPNHYLDSFGSLDVDQVTTCAASHVCSVQTKIGFRGDAAGWGAPEVIEYDAPTSAPYQAVVVGTTTTQAGDEAVVDGWDVPAHSAAP